MRNICIYCNIHTYIRIFTLVHKSILCVNMYVCVCVSVSESVYMSVYMYSKSYTE